MSLPSVTDICLSACVDTFLGEYLQKYSRNLMAKCYTNVCKSFWEQYTDSSTLTDNEEDPHQEEDHSKDHTTDPQGFIIWKEESEDTCRNAEVMHVFILLEYVNDKIQMGNIQHKLKIFNTEATNIKFY